MRTVGWVSKPRTTSINCTHMEGGSSQGLNKPARRGGAQDPRETMDGARGLLVGP
jgi:hypothetical protein